MDFYDRLPLHQMKRPHESPEAFTAPIRIQSRLAFPGLADEEPIFVIKILREVLLQTPRMPRDTRENPRNSLNELSTFFFENTYFECYNDHVSHPLNTLLFYEPIFYVGKNSGNNLLLSNSN